MTIRRTHKPKRKRLKPARYARVFARTLRSLNRKKASGWINKNLKSHPFILGICAFVWFAFLLDNIIDPQSPKAAAKELAQLHLYLIVGWFIGVVVSNLLRDTQKVHWFLKKRFVFTSLVLFPPAGLILLWSGSRFKRVTKVVLTVVFLSLFTVYTVYREKKSNRYVHMPPFERMVQHLFERRLQTFLKRVPVAGAGSLKLAELPPRKATKMAISDLYNRSRDGVAAITTKNKEGKPLGQGSGFVVSTDGIIVTNAHVLRSAHQAEVKIGARTFSDVSILKVVQHLDIALLKVDAKDLTPLFIGKSDQLAVGQVVVAIGNPLGFESSVTSGIVSAIRSSRDIKLIQMTTPVSPGSSGGPLFNEAGEVVGITTLASFFLGQNVNFAVPIDYLKNIIESERKAVKPKDK